LVAILLRLKGLLPAVFKTALDLRKWFPRRVASDLQPRSSNQGESL